MRNVNPDDLDRLATLLDGRGGVADRTDEAFTRASRLGVSDRLNALKPLRAWVSDTAPDLRRRATVARLEDGDPEAGLRWAGFNAKDIAEAALYLNAPGVLLLANAIAVSGDPGAETFRHRRGESLDDWVDRLRAHGITTAVPALKPYEGEITEILGAVGDTTSTVRHGGVAVFHSVNLTKVLVGNSVTQGALGTYKSQFAGALLRFQGRYTWVPETVAGWAARLDAWNPPVKSLSAPGTWLPSKLAGLASGNALYQDASRVPLLNTSILARVGDAYDTVRASGLMNARIAFGISGNSLIDGLVGSDRLAKMYGGLTHAEQIPGRAAQASLWKVTRNVFADERLFGAGRLAALGRGVKIAGKAGGALRGVGVIGGLISTGYSIANVVAQGNPKTAYKKKGAGYVADVAEIGFNASLTAATIAPNPYTIGAVAVTGAVYAGAKVVEHWDDIKKGAGEATKWVDHNVSDLGKGIAKSKANPMNWF
ncbi:PE-PGRS family protein [Streptomyces sp. NPDC090075]|uniref:PE-PGRS family protein n=1 Tax=Streptomyces sp. NPDC090075 TaxID=3365937 RepID=UPI00381C6CE7